MNRNLLITVLVGLAVLSVSLFPAEAVAEDPAPTRQSIGALIRRADSLRLASMSDSAVSVAEDAVRLSRQLTDQPDTLLVLALTALGNAQRINGNFDAAIATLQKAVEIAEQLDETGRHSTYLALNGLGKAYLAVYRYDEAEATFLLAIEMREQNGHLNEPGAIHTLWSLEDIYRVTGRYKLAKSAILRVMELTEQVHDSEHHNIVRCHSELGFLARVMAEFDSSEYHYKTALAIAEQVIDSVNYSRTIARFNSELGYLYELLGRYDEAEQRLKTALSIWTQSKLPRETQLAILLKNLGNLYKAQGRFEEAERAYWESYEIRLENEGGESHFLAESLSNLGDLYTELQRFDEAEKCFKRAVAYREEFYGPNHSYLYYSVIGLGRLYVIQGRFDEAETILKRCLDICNHTLGEDHLHTSNTLKLIGDLYRNKAMFPEADSCYRRALEIQEHILGPDNAVTAETLRSLALLNSATGDFSTALSYYEHLLHSRHAFIAGVFAYTSEEQKMRYLDIHPPIENSLFSLALADSSIQSAKAALDMLLRGKAIVLEALTAQKELVCFCKYNESMQRMADELCSVCGKISTLEIARSRSTDDRVYKNRLASLYQARDSLEVCISQECAEARENFSAEQVNIKVVADALPDSSVLWEFAVYTPHHLDVTEKTDSRSATRYLAFTLDKEMNISVVDLGRTDQIDSLVHLSRELIEALRKYQDREMLVESEQRIRNVTGMLRDKVFLPLQASLDHRDNIYIAPDGQLSLFPFEILPSHDGRYLIEEYEISYLSAGRDLLKFDSEPPLSNIALVMADPAFDVPSEAHKQPSRHQHAAFDHAIGGQSLLRDIPQCRLDMFSPLGQTREEAYSVANMLADSAYLRVEVRLGADASEETIKDLPVAPRVCHLATHGFFCEDSDSVSSRLEGNPFLRSGLAFAGANESIESHLRENPRLQDGILTALEVSGLNLYGTELVVLSACQTGIGDVRNGEGVFGLRRAFQHAGVQTMIMSLWRVPSRETSELMTGFYGRWLSGMSKRCAFRHAALEIINRHREKYGIAHPFYWGAFVLLGNPG